MDNPQGGFEEDALWELCKTAIVMYLLHESRYAYYRDLSRFTSPAVTFGWTATTIMNVSYFGYLWFHQPPALNLLLYFALVLMWCAIVYACAYQDVFKLEYRLWSYRWHLHYSNLQQLLNMNARVPHATRRSMLQSIKDREVELHAMFENGGCRRWVITNQDRVDVERENAAVIEGHKNTWKQRRLFYGWQGGEV